MRAFVIAMLVLAGCRERGTIDVPLVQPCDNKAYDRAAVYFFQGASCDDYSCTTDVTCDARGGCSSACESGYCSLDELDALTVDPAPGDYAVVIEFHYAGDASDGGIVCYRLHIDADGDESHTEMAIKPQCCAEGQAE